MNFELNINNYTKNELIEIFELPQNYNSEILLIKENKLTQNILNDNKINDETKLKTINFLLKAKNILLNNLSDTYNTNYELKGVQLQDTNEHMLQVKPKNPYVSSFPSEFFPGIINPLRKKTIKKNLTINTKFRDNYYSNMSTDFNIVLPTNFNNVLQMQLNSLELPISYYTVSKKYGNNFFNITINNVTNVVIIPDGHYTYDSIAGVINNQLSLIGGDFANIIFMINALNTSGNGLMMVGFSPTSLIPPVNFELNFQSDEFENEDKYTPLPLKLGWLLGFRNGIYTNNQNYVSEGIVDISGPSYFYLVVDDHNNNVYNNYYSAFNSSTLNKNILARISLQSVGFGLLIQNDYNIVSIPREYFGPVNIQNLHIQLLDEYGRIVDLTNMDFSFSLNLTTSYDL
jgi:hypothetical protein